MFKKINLVKNSFNLLSGISFLFNSFQSVFADFLFGISIFSVINISSVFIFCVFNSFLELSYGKRC